jgi:hypothetical protein
MKEGIIMVTTYFPNGLPVEPKGNLTKWRNDISSPIAAGKDSIQAHISSEIQSKSHSGISSPVATVWLVATAALMSATFVVGHHRSNGWLVRRYCAV